MITRELRNLVEQAALEGHSWEQIEKQLRISIDIEDSDVGHLKAIYNRSITNKKKESEKTAWRDEMEEKIAQNSSQIQKLQDFENQLRSLEKQLEEVTRYKSDYINVPKGKIAQAPFYIRAWFAKNT